MGCRITAPEGVLLRTFVCVKIPEGHLKILDKWISARRLESKEIRWVEPKNIHITLKFCGEKTPAAVQILAHNLERIKRRGPFSLSIEGIGGFPNLRNPRVVWAGIKGDVRCLQDIQSDVEFAAFRAGISREDRPYSPHITLGRRRSTQTLPENIKSAMEADVLLLEPWTVDEITLMLSELSRFGPRYTPLGLFKM